MTCEKHPRIRGENVSKLVASLGLRETSPHTRGELWDRLSLDLGPGNIPAYAGRTAGRQTGYRTAQKHPRIRGENNRHAQVVFYLRETSPHTRGEHAFIEGCG